MTGERATPPEPARPWVAEHPVGRELAAALIAEQFPDVDVSDLRRLGQGWDNDVWRAGPLAFRFPRRAVAVGLLRIEARLLPALSPRLPLPIPAPTHFGAAGPRFPAPFLGYPCIEGRTADRAGLTDDDAPRLAPPLGRFLRALHDLDPDATVALGMPSRTGRSDVTSIAGSALKRVDGLRVSRWTSLVAQAEPLLRNPPRAALRFTAVPLHGDLYVRHLVIDEGGGLAGVIDWGDTCLGDPAVDLAIAFSLLPAAARPAFFAEYGPIDEATARRARHFGVGHRLLLLASAHDRGDEALAVEAARRLRCLLA